MLKYFIVVLQSFIGIKKNEQINANYLILILTGFFFAFLFVALLVFFVNLIVH
jgi:hypothetical protein